MPPADIENMGEMIYYPYQGVADYYYPYKNQRGYLSPAVFLNLKNPKSKLAETGTKVGAQW
jgi:Sodium / potassium ATPase beta chain